MYIFFYLFSYWIFLFLFRSISSFYRFFKLTRVFLFFFLSFTEFTFRLLTPFKFHPLYPFLYRCISSLSSGLFISLIYFLSLLYVFRVIPHSLSISPPPLFLSLFSFLAFFFFLSLLILHPFFLSFYALNSPISTRLFSSHLICLVLCFI